MSTILKHFSLSKFVLFLFFFLNVTTAKVLMSSELMEVLQRKSVINDPENRVIVAFKTKQDPNEELQKIPFEFLSGEQYRSAVGNSIVNAMNTENWELEQMLLEIVKAEQIVRRLPIGNSFVLEGLDMQQADKISQLEQTVLLSLSRFTERSETPSEARFNKCSGSGVKSTGFLFNEPVKDIKEWEYSATCDPLHKSTCQLQNAPWNQHRIKAPQSWSKGYTGRGIIYGVIDTGVSYKHPVLQKNYYGLKPDGTYDHNYAWFDGVRKKPQIFGYDYVKDLQIDELEDQLDEELNGLYATERKSNYSEFFKRGPQTEGDLIDDDDGSEDGYDGDVSRSASSDERGSFDFAHAGYEKIRAAVDQCGYATPEPCDSCGHGTHVTSTAVGGFGIGTAPEARWMACRSISGKYGREEDALACLNFFLAPHDLNGKNPRPDLRPHVIGNSYGWESWAEVAGAGLDLAVKRLESAGTVMVFAAGNTGPNCATIHTAFSFTVGATTEKGTLAKFSSRGPWTISLFWSRRPLDPRRPLLIKPDISAPGDDIVGAFGPQYISRMSGTSMATPHVSGSIALLLQACPKLIGKSKEIQNLLERTARRLFVPFGVKPCGRDTFQSTPNNFYGAGELDIEAAIESCKAEA